MRKTIQGFTSTPDASGSEIDVERLAHVFVSSEDPQHPIENAFDARRGPGGSQWVASGPGTQTVTLAFDAPQHVEEVSIEVEETGQSRTQEVELAVSSNGGGAFDARVRQEFNFSPGGATFERETWAVKRSAVSHVRLTIRPDKGGGEARARLTSFVVRSGPRA